MKNNGENSIVSHSCQKLLCNRTCNDHSGAAMDNLPYHYAKDSKDNILSNRLLHVNDAVVNNATTKDIKNQGNYEQQRPLTHNYVCDEIDNFEVISITYGICSILDNF